MYPEMSIREIEDTKLKDINILMEAHQKNTLDKMFLLSYNAWQNRNAKATNRNGTYTARYFSDLFDYDKHLSEIENKKSKKREKKFSRKALSMVARINNS